MIGGLSTPLQENIRRNIDADERLKGSTGQALYRIVSIVQNEDDIKIQNRNFTTGSHHDHMKPPPPVMIRMQPKLRLKID